MSDWDASDNEAPASKAPVVHKKSKWEEEEEDDNVADDWDVSEEESAAPTPAPVAPPKKKGTLKQKIAQKEAAKSARAANGLDSDADDDEVDEAEKRRLEREMELAADLNNAADLLGGPSAVNGQGAAPSELHEILTANPKTKEDFQKLSTLIYERLIKPHESKPLFATFIELHVREIAQSLRDVDVRRAATALTTLSNEKMKEKTQTGKKKTKAAAKPILGAAKAGRIDTSAYDESLDDFGKEKDDFM
ncbi:translation initiation factor eIF3 subunit [Dacryopinax primogenitus]|uniref:Eukaryotic translation initiation factor 3 subunit J n=1 Tax=Dacryopinax primogenitus (strain DJM 731) TaxID=1858805 RepID=M5G9R1_DACPD|nr:translation initiation factor eIF3 subunit [Dacryopinax primogenitus]EJU05025.1 translation initiation factor eIF3 subunit [Dacryopinax primogenitus]